MEHALEMIELRRRKARRTMARDLDGLNLENLPQMLLVPSLPDPFRSGNLTGTIWDCLAPWLEAAFPGQELLDQEDAVALHALRIRVKRLRYALEVLGAGFAAPPEGQLKHLKGLQTALGSHHDLATLEALLDGLRQGLEARGRAVLAAGTQDVLVHLGEERLIAFEQFRALGVGMPREDFVGGLRSDLGLDPGASAAP
jgi:hypothetical protein